MRKPRALTDVLSFAAAALAAFGPFTAIGAFSTKCSEISMPFLQVRVQSKVLLLRPLPLPPWQAGPFREGYLPLSHPIECDRRYPLLLWGAGPALGGDRVVDLVVCT